ncbi:MAG: IS21 family transposase [Candidatus Omnitrophica bacterium]|nr:IS21 family transposase [Candidatus Omnitrophota bacterium]
MDEAQTAARQESLHKRILHLHQVEKLSQRQIAEKLNVGRKLVKKILNNSGSAKAIGRKTILEEYNNLVAHWYKEHPRLRATQVYERLKGYGYTGSYPSVVLLCRKYRQPKTVVYHTLNFLPGEEAQVDWFFFNHKTMGQVAGFLYVLAYSRYAWGIFYPKTTFEFFLAGHHECFKHIGGLAHRHRYDNVKSVVLSRSPVLRYNPQFLDFARFYGFTIHLCNPYKGNEKGRVERIIRDIRVFLYGEDFVDLVDLNRKFHQWLIGRNNRIHRTTGKTPKELLLKERLIPLAQNAYSAGRIIHAASSKTALVEFETNKYSLPSTCASKPVEIIAYPETIEICVSGRKATIHKRCFAKNKIIQNPLHVEKLLNRTTPQFKMQRIQQLIMNMNQPFKEFITFQDNDRQKIETAYQLFQLLKTHSKVMLISAVRELVAMRCFKIKALCSLLNLPEPKEGDPLWPQNTHLLNLTYEERNLKDYDPNSDNMEST